MVIYNITDFPKFFETLDDCRDSLTLITPDGKSYDYHANRTLLRSLLSNLDRAQCSRIELKLAQDQNGSMSKLLCYLLTKDRAAPLAG